MGACRENKNIWWYLFTFCPNYGGNGRRWRGRDVFSRRWWEYREYIFHDSIGHFWNRWIKCPITGHKNVKNVAEPREPVEWYCFDCEQRVGRKGKD